MGTVTNLNKARKAQQRALRQKKADENSVKYGQPKHMKTLNIKQRIQDEQRLDGHKMTEPDDKDK